MPFYRKPQYFTPLAKLAERKSVKNGLHHAIFTSRFDSFVGEWSKDRKEGKGLFLTIKGKLYEGDWYKGFRRVVTCLLQALQQWLMYWQSSLPAIMARAVLELPLTLRTRDAHRLRMNSNRHGVRCCDFRVEPWSHAAYRSPSIPYLLHGFGTLSHRLDNGTFKLDYRGDWVRGKPEGIGWWWYENGDVYFGYWKKGRRHGFGKMFYADGTYYVGYWSEGKKNGLGMFVQANGNRYEGHWEVDMKSGLGRFYHMHTGQLQEGCWMEDICVKSKMTDILIRQFCDMPTQYPLPPEELVDSKQLLEESELWLQQKIGDIDKNLQYCIDQLW